MSQNEDMREQLADTIIVLEVLRRFRNSEAMVAIRKYLDSMSPEDFEGAERGIKEFIESDDSVGDFVQAIQRLRNIRTD